jgi:hypothetical protein
MQTTVGPEGGADSELLLRLEARRAACASEMRRKGEPALPSLWLAGCWEEEEEEEEKEEEEEEGRRGL